MFGYIRPDIPYMYVKDGVLYKALYCGLCKSIGGSCGQRARMGLSYDMTFLSAILHNMMHCDVKIEKKTLRPASHRPPSHRRGRRGHAGGRLPEYFARLLQTHGRRRGRGKGESDARVL